MDRHIQKLRRQYSSGDISAGRRLLRELLRTGQCEINDRHIRLAAAYGNDVCIDYLGYQPLEDQELPTTNGIITLWPCQAYVRRAWAAANCAYQELCRHMDIGHMGPYTRMVRNVYGDEFGQDRVFALWETFENPLEFMREWIDHAGEGPIPQQTPTSLVNILDEFSLWLHEAEAFFYENNYAIHYTAISVNNAVQSIRGQCSFPTHVSVHSTEAVNYARLAVTSMLTAESPFYDEAAEPNTPWRLARAQARPSNDALMIVHKCIAAEMLPWLLQPYPH